MVSDMSESPSHPMDVESADRHAAPASFGTCDGNETSGRRSIHGRRAWRSIGAPFGLMGHPHRAEAYPIRFTGNWSDQPEMCADLVGNADRKRTGGKPVVAPRKEEQFMAVAETRPVVPAVLYDVDEAAEALRLSRSVLYELIRSGRLRTVKQGRRRCR